MIHAKQLIGVVNRYLSHCQSSVVDSNTCLRLAVYLISVTGAVKARKHSIFFLSFRQTEGGGGQPDNKIMKEAEKDKIKR